MSLFPNVENPQPTTTHNSSPPAAQTAPAPTAAEVVAEDQPYPYTLTVTGSASIGEQEAICKGLDEVLSQWESSDNVPAPGYVNFYGTQLRGDPRDFFVSEAAPESGTEATVPEVTSPVTPVEEPTGGAPSGEPVPSPAPPSTAPEVTSPVTPVEEPTGGAPSGEPVPSPAPPSTAPEEPTSTTEDVLSLVEKVEAKPEEERTEAEKALLEAAKNVLDEGGN